MYKSIRKLVVLMQITVVEILFQDSLYDSGTFFFFFNRFKLFLSTVSSFFFPSDVISEDLIYVVSKFSFLNGLWPL